jgi:hypothetical protein
MAMLVFYPTAYLVLGRKILGCHIRYHMSCCIRCLDTNLKTNYNKLQNLLVNHEMNLLSLINLSLAHVCTVAPYCQSWTN